MDTYQFIAEITRSIVSTAWPMAVVLVAYIVKLIMDDNPNQKPAPPPPPKPRENPYDSNRQPHPPAPTYPPR